METRIFLIGQGLFRAGLEHALAREPNLSVVGSVNTWAEAQTLMADARPEVLIVDNASKELRHVSLLLLAAAETQNLKVILLTLSENRIEIIDQHQESNVSLADLLNLLQPSVGTSGEHQGEAPC
jgi:DNA-binding NarL/FixJ family response regulator